MEIKEAIGLGYSRMAEKVYVSDAFYNECLAIEKNYFGDILDIGCGQGVVLKKLKEKFGDKIKTLTGIELSKKLLEMAGKNIPEARLLIADAENLPFGDNSFDFVIMIDVFQYLLDFDKALEEIKKVLRPNGKFIVTAPNREWILFNDYIKKRKNIQPLEDHFFDFEEMAGLLEKHNFKILKYRGADCLRYYAPYHKYEMLLAKVFPWLHKKMKKIIFLVRP